MNAIDLRFFGGGVIVYDGATLTVADGHGVPFTVAMDPPSAYVVLRDLAVEPHGINRVHAAAPVVISWIYADDSGAAFVYVHTADCSASLAPILLRGSERAELASLLR